MAESTRRHRIPSLLRDRRALLGTLLAMMVIAQGLVTLRTTIAPMYADARDVRGLPSLQRGGVISFGDNFAAYIGFLRSQVPEAARVVIPPFDLDPVYGNLGLMQFFLFPREIVNCPSGPDLSACTSSLTSPNTYLMRVRSFPHPESVARGRLLLQFDDQLGLYALSGPGSHQTETTPQESWSTDVPSLISPTHPDVRFIAGGILLCLFVAIGGLLVANLLGTSRVSGYGGLFFPVGFGTVTWLLFLGSLANLPFRPFLVLAGLLVALVGLLYFNLRRTREEKVPISRKPRFLDAPAVVALGIGFVLIAALSVQLAYSEWDAIAFWSIKGYGIAWDAAILASPSWGAPGQSHPLGIPIGIAVMRMLQGDSEPMSKVLNPLFFASLALGCFQFWRRRGAPRMLALACALLLSSVPLLVEHATNGYANLPAATYLALGTIIIVRGAIEKDRRTQWLGGWLLGLATWTRSDAFPILIALLPALYLTLRVNKGANVCARCLMVPTLLIGGTWLVSAPTYTSGGYAMGALQMALVGLQRGDLNFTAIYRAVRALGGDLLEPLVWGFLFPASIALSIFAVANWRRADRHAGIPILSSALAAGAVLLAMFYSLTYEGGLQVWLDTGLARLFIPAVLLAWVGLVTLAIGSPSDLGLPDAGSDLPTHAAGAD